MSSKDSAAKAKINKSSLLRKYGLWWVSIPKPVKPETYSEDEATLLVEDGKWYITLRSYLFDLLGNGGYCVNVTDNHYVTIEDIYFSPLIFEKLEEYGLSYNVRVSESIFDERITEVSEECAKHYRNDLYLTSSYVVHVCINDMIE